MIGVNFLWHMHQPDYRPAGGGAAILPWVRLHAVSGYLDLLSALQQHANAHCVVNFSGILLEQLLKYSPQERDIYAELSLRDPATFTAEETVFVTANFFSANVNTLIKPQARYWELYQNRAAKFDAQELRDLLVWFNLAWIGFTGRKRDDVQGLIQKGRGYSADDQAQVLAIHDELVAEVLPGYKALADDGRIELSFTPYHHPILPLLHDLAGEGTAVAGDPLPEFSYPQDAIEQVRRGMQWHERAFGRLPLGAWPAEGSVSDAALATLADAGLMWAATDQQNLLQAAPAHLTPWRWKNGERELTLFFRDTRLSDNIGFVYSTWKPADAVADFISSVVKLAESSEYEAPIVSVILDGENPWESYPDGGEAFLHELFTQLAAHPELECITPSMLQGKQWPALEHVHSGSWVGGNFDIWTKAREARQAWRLLARARADLGSAELRSAMSPGTGPSSDRTELDPAVRAHLLAAEGSDWFWWYGDTFHSDQKPQFDELFRGHLIAAYELAGRPVPPAMYSSILSADLADWIV